LIDKDVVRAHSEGESGGQDRQLGLFGFEV